MSDIQNISPGNIDNEQRGKTNHTGVVNDTVIPIINKMHTDISFPYHITPSLDPMDQTMKIPIIFRYKHSMLGL